jgi:antitoxin component of MazEF toxin-antitoxin module
MQGTIAKWGNSLALRISRAIAVQLGAREGSRRAIVVECRKLILSPAPTATEDDPFAAFGEWGAATDSAAYRNL